MAEISEERLRKLQQFELEKGVRESILGWIKTRFWISSVLYTLLIGSAGYGVIQATVGVAVEGALETELADARRELKIAVSDATKAAQQAESAAFDSRVKTEAIASQLAQSQLSAREAATFANGAEESAELAARTSHAVTELLDDSAEALGRAQARLIPVTAALARLQTEIENVQSFATFLSQYGPYPERVLALQKQASSEDPSVRRNAAIVCSQLCSAPEPNPKPQALVDLLLSALQDPHPEVIMAAMSVELVSSEEHKEALQRQLLTVVFSDNASTARIIASTKIAKRWYTEPVSPELLSIARTGLEAESDSEQLIAAGLLACAANSTEMSQDLLQRIRSITERSTLTPMWEDPENLLFRIGALHIIALQLADLPITKSEARESLLLLAGNDSDLISLSASASLLRLGFPDDAIPRLRKGLKVLRGSFAIDYSIPCALALKTHGIEDEEIGEILNRRASYIGLPSFDTEQSLDYWLTQSDLFEIFE